MSEDYFEPDIKLYGNILVRGRDLPGYSIIYALSICAIENGLATNQAILNLLFSICTLMHRRHGMTFNDIHIEHFFKPASPDLSNFIMLCSRYIKWLGPWAERYIDVKEHVAEMKKALVVLEDYFHQKDNNFFY